MLKKQIKHEIIGGLNPKGMVLIVASKAEIDHLDRECELDHEGNTWEVGTSLTQSGSTYHYYSLHSKETALNQLMIVPNKALKSLHANKEKKNQLNSLYKSLFHERTYPSALKIPGSPISQYWNTISGSPPASCGSTPQPPPPQVG